MIVDVILDDHQAVREMMAVAGNAPLPADEERAIEFGRFRKRWHVHGAMMEKAVYPILLKRIDAAEAGIIEEAKRLHATVEAMAADLERQEERHMPNWQDAFERLKSALERQCDLEAISITSLILSAVPSDDKALMMHTARTVRGAALQNRPS